jgi:SOS-response transcriptional repressor LexA
MLTARQKQLLDFIRSEIARCGVAPSYDEMAAAIGVRSKSGVNRLLLGLEERGAIRRLPSRRRAIEVIEVDDSRRITRLSVQDCIDLGIRKAHVHKESCRGSFAKKQLIYHLTQAKVWLEKLPKGEG